MDEQLTDRKKRILKAIIKTYMETGEPVGSRTCLLYTSPSTDTYIAKDASTNDEIDKLRLSATAALCERKDVIAVSYTHLGSLHDLL